MPLTLCCYHCWRKGTKSHFYVSDNLMKSLRILIISQLAICHHNYDHYFTLQASWNIKMIHVIGYIQTGCVTDCTKALNVTEKAKFASSTVVTDRHHFPALKADTFRIFRSTMDHMTTSAVCERCELKWWIQGHLQQHHGNQTWSPEGVVLCQCRGDIRTQNMSTISHCSKREVIETIGR